MSENPQEMNALPQPINHIHSWVSENITEQDVYYHGVLRVLTHQKTQYQDMLIVDNGTQGLGLVLDGKWQSCTGDEFLYHEPLVHIPMLNHGAPKTVLVLGGGEGATIREVLKWNTVEKVVMVDIDAEVVTACREHLPQMSAGAFEDPRTELVITDAFDYLARTEYKFDVIISDLSDPIEEGPSFKLFTSEYMQECKKVMTENAVFCIQAGPVAPYNMSLHVRIANTVANVFEDATNYASCVPTYCSPWGFAIGRDHHPVIKHPDPLEIDKIIAQHIHGPLRMFDGITMRGLLSSPKHVRQAIEKETMVYTLDMPPIYNW